MSAKKSILIEAQKLTIEPSTVGVGLTVRIIDPSEECLIRLAAESLQLLNKKTVKKETE